MSARSVQSSSGTPVKTPRQAHSNASTTMSQVPAVGRYYTCQNCKRSFKLIEGGLTKNEENSAYAWIQGL